MYLARELGMCLAVFSLFVSVNVVSSLRVARDLSDEEPQRFETMRELLGSKTSSPPMQQHFQAEQSAPARENLPSDRTEINDRSHVQIYPRIRDTIVFPQRKPYSWGPFETSDQYHGGEDMVDRHVIDYRSRVSSPPVFYAPGNKMIVSIEGRKQEGRENNQRRHGRYRRSAQDDSAHTIDVESDKDEVQVHLPTESVADLPASIDNQQQNQSNTDVTRSKRHHLGRTSVDVRHDLPDDVPAQDHQPETPSLASRAVSSDHDSSLPTPEIFDHSRALMAVVRKTRDCGVNGGCLSETSVSASPDLSERPDALDTVANQPLETLARKVRHISFDVEQPTNSENRMDQIQELLKKLMDHQQSIKLKIFDQNLDQFQDRDQEADLRSVHQVQDPDQNPPPSFSGLFDESSEIISQDYTATEDKSSFKSLTEQLSNIEEIARNKIESRQRSSTETAKEEKGGEEYVEERVSNLDSSPASDIEELLRNMQVTHMLANITENIGFEALITNSRHISADLVQMNSALQYARAAMKRADGMRLVIDRHVTQMNHLITSLKHNHHESMKMAIREFVRVAGQRDSCVNHREFDLEEYKRNFTSKLRKIIKIFSSMHTNQSCLESNGKVAHLVWPHLTQTYMDKDRSSDVQDRFKQTKQLIMTIMKLRSKMSPEKLLSLVRIPAQRTGSAEENERLKSLVMFINKHHTEHPHNMDAMIGISRMIMANDLGPLTKRKVMTAALKMIRHGENVPAHIKQRLEVLLEEIQKRRSYYLRRSRLIAYLKLLKQVFCKQSKADV